MTTKATVLFALLCAGCAGHTGPVVMPDGAPAMSIGCSGALRSWGSCYEKAGELCGPAGYTVLERSDGQRFTVAGSADGFAGGTVIDRNMVVRCKSRGQ